MTDQPQAAAPAQEISQEFFIRVNDFIEMANRIERRHDVQHAQVAMLHAFARYSAHHYLTVTKEDTLEARAAYGDYITTLLLNFVQHYAQDMRNLPAQAPAADTAAE